MSDPRFKNIFALQNKDHFRGQRTSGANIAKVADDLSAGVRAVQFINQTSRQDLETAIAKTLAGVKILEGLIRLGTQGSKPQEKYATIWKNAYDEGLLVLSLLDSRVQDIEITNNIKKIQPSKSELDSVAVGDEKYSKETLINTMRSLIAQAPPGGWDTFDSYVGGEPYKELFTGLISDRFKFDNFKDLSQKGIQVLFYGPPGTGKTKIFEAIVASIPNCVFFNLTAGNLKGSFRGEIKDRISVLYALARDYAKSGPVVIAIDEVDGLFTEDRGSEQGSSEATAELNSQLAGVGKSNKNIVTLMSTNYPETLPQSIQDRLDRKFLIGLPTIDDTRLIVLNELKRFGKSRINMQIDWNRTKSIVTALGFDEDNSSKFNKLPYVNGGKITVDGNKIMDELDYITLELYNAGYAPRNIIGVIEAVKFRAQLDGTNFVETSIWTNLSIPQYQTWIKETVAFKSTSGEKASTKTWLTPIAFVNYTTGKPLQDDNGEPMKIGGYYVPNPILTINEDGIPDVGSKSRKLANPNKKREIVMTERTYKTEKDFSGWSYRIVKKAKTELSDDKKTKYTYIIGEPIFEDYTPASNEVIEWVLPAVLGTAQITSEHFAQSMNIVKPGKRTNISALVEYTQSYGQAPRAEDIVTLQELFVRETKGNHGTGAANVMGQLQAQGNM